jgi:hypothetical protein
MKIEIQKYGEDCSAINSRISGIAGNINFPLIHKSTFSVYLDQNQQAPTPGEILCLYFLEDQPLETYPDGISIEVIDIIPNLNLELVVSVEDLSCPC